MASLDFEAAGCRETLFGALMSSSKSPIGLSDSVSGIVSVSEPIS